MYDHTKGESFVMKEGAQLIMMSFDHYEASRNTHVRSCIRHYFCNSSVIYDGLLAILSSALRILFTPLSLFAAADTIGYKPLLSIEACANESTVSLNNEIKPK